MKVRKPERKKKETSKRRGGVPFLKAKSLVTLEAKNNFNRNLSFSSKKGKKMKFLQFPMIHIGGRSCLPFSSEDSLEESPGIFLDTRWIPNILGRHE